MYRMLQKASWTVALRGLVAVAFGVVLFAWPGITVEVLLKIFAIYAFVEGTVLVLGSLFHRHEHSDWPTLLLLGLFSVAVGVFVFAKPQLTALAFLYLIAARALVVGVLDIGMSVQVRKEVRNEWLIALSGIVSVLFALIVFARPVDSAIVILWLISIYAVVHGIFLMAFAFRARGAAKEIHQSHVEHVQQQ